MSNHERAADLFGYLPVIDESPPPASLCDGDCPPWWAILALHVPVGGCTPFTAMMLHHWHTLHVRAPEPDSDGILH